VAHPVYILCLFAKNDAKIQIAVTVKYLIRINMIRYDTRCYFNVRSKADKSQVNLPHGNDN